ncbi:MAG: hypothetical protein EOO40_00255 [Deltaproteobacteria bacterium]|nr:MAG: hypothetical protein EOO40_00255 [Deltaproteobacteria bacterium]
MSSITSATLTTAPPPAAKPLQAFTFKVAATDATISLSAEGYLAVLPKLMATMNALTLQDVEIIDGDEQTQALHGFAKQYGTEVLLELKNSVDAGYADNADAQVSNLLGNFVGAFNDHDDVGAACLEALDENLSSALGVASEYFDFTAYAESVEMDGEIFTINAGDSILLFLPQ